MVARGNYRDAFNQGNLCTQINGKPDPNCMPMIFNDYCATKNGQVACGTGSGQKVQNALKLGDTATGVMVAGGVLVAAGAVLWFGIGPREVKEKPVALVPVLAPDQTGLAVVGRF